MTIEDSYKVPWDPTGKWEPWEEFEEVSYSQIPPESEASPGQSAEPRTQSPGEKHFRPATHHQTFVRAMTNNKKSKR